MRSSRQSTRPEARLQPRWRPAATLTSELTGLITLGLGCAAGQRDEAGGQREALVIAAPLALIARHWLPLVDMMDDIVRVARAAKVSPEAVFDRLADDDDDDPVSRMPFLGQMRQMLFARMRNSHQRWEANDLVDIIFLCCAAGYADLVVGERRTIGYLRQARQPPPRAQLATSLREVLELLERG